MVDVMTNSELRQDEEPRTIFGRPADFSKALSEALFVLRWTTKPVAYWRDEKARGTNLLRMNSEPDTIYTSTRSLPLQANHPAHDSTFIVQDKRCVQHLRTRRDIDRPHGLRAKLLEGFNWALYAM